MSRDSSDSIPAAAHQFATTHWSVVLAAGRDHDTRSREALARLCHTYWYPLYAFVRRQGPGPEDAQDLTQSFFAHLLGSHALGKVDRAKGKFRSFLLASLRHFLANERERAATQKRGGGRVLIPLDVAAAETRYGLEAPGTESPDKLFERNWALTLLERAVDRLRAEHAAAGHAAQFELLQDCLVGDPEAPRYTDLAARLESSAGAVKMAVGRLRRRCGQLLREEIAHTVSSPAEVEEEIRHLFAVLGG